MLDDFIAHHLPSVDDLAELKVSLVTLRLLEQKLSPAPFVTEAELMAQPAIRDGLSFPAISLRPALQRAVARGTLLMAQLGDEPPRYFMNDVFGRRAVDTLHDIAVPRQKSNAEVMLRVVAREIERLEQVDVYAPTHDDLPLIADWLACGYDQDEIIAATKLTLRSPRPKHLPVRGVKDIHATLIAMPPAQPTEYYAIVVGRTQRPPEEIINLRMRLGRAPTAHEFTLVRHAVGLFGLRATLDALKRVSSEQGVDVEALLPSLAEQEAATVALQRTDVESEVTMRALVQLYESTLGMPPTGAIANEMQGLLKELPDTEQWRSVFEYVARQNKRSWAYVRKLLQNPSPDVFMPQPVNDTAQFAFNEYKKRVNRLLDASIANEINDVAKIVAEIERWKSAFDKAAAANALRWDYIKKVLTTPDKPDPKNDRNHGRTKQATPNRRGSTFRRPQATFTDEERAADEARARQRLAQRAKPAE